MARYVVAVGVILAIAGIAVQGRQQPEAKPAPRADAPGMAANRALAKEQLAVIDEAVDLQHALVRHGKLVANDPSFAVWGLRRLETLRRTGAGKAEIVAALEKYIESLKGEEEDAKQRLEAARGTKADVLDARYRRMEAEIWLNEEKAR